MCIFHSISDKWKPLDNYLIGAVNPLVGKHHSSDYFYLCSNRSQENNYAKFGQPIWIEEYFELLSYAKFKKKRAFLPEYDQLSIAKILNRKLGNLILFPINYCLNLTNNSVTYF